jgi:dihydroneopterin aldolase/2-amino-4-hydroxy-6-hydroxymethyldihydropteridine diphosphokinase
MAGGSSPAGTLPVVLALGANLGDPVRTLTSAVDALSAAEGLTVVAVSPLARTEPVGGPDQPAYLNAVVLARTTLTPQSVLALAHEVEAAAGRERSVRWGPRTLDVDVVQYGEPPDTADSDDPDLTLPHPRAHERAFVLWPWAQADPGAVLVRADGAEEPVAALAEQAPDRPGLVPGPSWPARSRAAALVRRGELRAAER